MNIMNMKMKLFVVGFLVVSGAGATTDLFACGAKFLMANRGTRFGRAAAARHPAAVLVYANPASMLPEALRKVEIEKILGKAGYRPTVVSNQAELDQALNEGEWDIVVADLSDSASLRAQLHGKDAPMIVPVMLKPSKDEFKQAERDYGRVVKGPVKSQRFLETIAEAVAMTVELREKAVATA